MGPLFKHYECIATYFKQLEERVLHVSSTMKLYTFEVMDMLITLI